MLANEGILETNPVLQTNSSSDQSWITKTSSEAWKDIKGAARIASNVGEGALDQIMQHPVETAAQIGVGIVAAGAIAEAGIGTLRAAALTAIPLAAYGLYEGVQIARYEGIGAIKDHVVNAYHDTVNATIKTWHSASDVFNGKSTDADVAQLKSFGAQSTPFAAGLIGGSSTALGREVIRGAYSLGSTGLNRLADLTLLKAPQLVPALVDGFQPEQSAAQLSLAASKSMDNLLLSVGIGGGRRGFHESAPDDKSSESESSKPPHGSDKSAPNEVESDVRRQRIERVDTRLQDFFGTRTPLQLRADTGELLDINSGDVATSARPLHRRWERVTLVARRGTSFEIDSGRLGDILFNGAPLRAAKIEELSDRIALQSGVDQYPVISNSIGSRSIELESSNWNVRKMISTEVDPRWGKRPLLTDPWRTGGDELATSIQWPANPEAYSHGFNHKNFIRFEYDPKNPKPFILTERGGKRVWEEDWLYSMTHDPDGVFVSGGKLFERIPGKGYLANPGGKLE